jgi:hypothetical protein
VESLAAGGAPALSAALMASEARKNEALLRAARAYERCRQVPRRDKNGASSHRE